MGTGVSEDTGEDASQLVFCFVGFTYHPSVCQQPILWAVIVDNSLTTALSRKQGRKPGFTRILTFYDCLF